MPSGIFMARPESLTAISAWLPGEWHVTRSPFLKSRTSAPTSITSPENSLPIGLPAVAPWLVSPVAEPRSARLSAIALILMRRSVALGLGSGTSWMTTPFGDATPAFMALTPPRHGRHSRPKGGVAMLAYVPAIHALLHSLERRGCPAQGRA